MIEPSQPTGPQTQRASIAGGPLGLVAVILAGLAWVFSAARSAGLLLTPLTPDFAASYRMYALFSTVSAVIVLVVALAALACGIIGLVRVRSRRSLTVIATTIAAFLVFDIVYFGVLSFSTGFFAGRF